MNFIRRLYRSIRKHRYIVYHLRWQLSAVVMMPVMYSLYAFQLPLWATLMLSQFFGALIFWYIDLLIFTNTRSSSKSKPREDE
jgi:hypothetical protein